MIGLVERDSLAEEGSQTAYCVLCRQNLYERIEKALVCAFFQQERLTFFKQMGINIVGSF